MFRKEALDRLSSLEELDELMHVTNPRSWLALLALGALLVLALIWGLFATISTTVTGRGVLTAAADANALDATVFVTLDDMPQIQPGMSVKLALSSVKKEHYGLLLGTIATVEDLPANGATMLRVLNNDAYMQTLASAGQLVPVHVTLQRDPATASGYQWSSPQGATVALHEGMVCNGTIIVSEQRAIDLVIP